MRQVMLLQLEVPAVLTVAVVLVATERHRQEVREVLQVPLQQTLVVLDMPVDLLDLILQTEPSRVPMQQVMQLQQVVQVQQVQQVQTEGRQRVRLREVLALQEV